MKSESASSALDSSTDTEEEDDLLPSKPARYRSPAGKRMTDQGAQTGGVGGKKVPAAPKVPATATLGSVMGKMKLSLSFPEGVALKPHFRRLLQNITAYESWRSHEELTVVKGTPIREVTEARLWAERDMLEGMDIRGVLNWEEEIAKLDKQLAREEKLRAREAEREEKKRKKKKRRHRGAWTAEERA